MIWVFVFLGGLFLLMFILRYIGNRMYGQDELITATDPLLEVESNEGNETELVAVLTAAAATSLKKRVVVRKFHYIDNASDTAWSQSGRLNILASHQVPLIKK
jgi:hypothetical protein